MLDADALADEINTAIAATDAQGDPIATTPEMKAYAKAVVDTLQAAIVANAPGTVTGIGVPAGGPLTGGAASNGLMTLVSSIWQAALAAGFPTAMPVKLSSEASASTSHLMSNAPISFSSGGITGTCTSIPVPPAPGILVAGAGTGGKIGGVTGDPWAADVTGSQGIASTPVAKAIYGAISTYIKANAEAAYSTGGVVGTFAPIGGPLIAGSGVAGTIS